MNIFELLTKNNIRIIQLIDKEPLHIRDIADKLKISPGSAHKLASLLKKEGLVKEIKQKNRIILSINNEKSIIKEIKRVINFSDIINAKAFERLSRLGSLGIYGSFADGTNDKESDLDLWIKTEKKELELRQTIRELENEMKVKVNLLILTKSRLESLKKNDPEFYLRLQLTSIGDNVDQ
jgi:predicted nucleotidyltransferase